VLMTSHDKSPREDIFAAFPRGLALLELVNPDDVSTWRLLEINDFASTLVSPSIETFLSGELLRVVAVVDLPALYREVLFTRSPRVIGMVERRDQMSRPRVAIGPESQGMSPQATGNDHLYVLHAFPVGTRTVGIFFEAAYPFVTGSNGRVEAERQLSLTCEFLGAILWRAEPETLRFTYVSPRAQTLLGYWLERWTGETNFWKKHLFPDDRELVVNACQKILRERKREDFEFRMIGVHGQILWFHAAGEIIESTGRKPELAGVMNDITGLKRAEERIRALSSRLMRLQDDERRRISRELHDSLGQYLTSMKINFDILKRETGSLGKQHRALLVESAETLEKCVQEVRSVSYLLHPPLLDELGLLAALRWFTAGFSERSGIVINLDTPNEFSRLPKEMELALFRIVQESLTNIQRHSQSDIAWVTLSEHKDSAEVCIVDRGVGVPSEVVDRIKQGKTLEGIGLRGMYERVRELGGQLEIQSSALGTTVSAVLPLKFAAPKREGEERKSRLAGKRISRREVSDVRIESVAAEKTGVRGHPAAGDPKLRRASAAQRRRASRR
jgi:PAS domain S-box-containing protein